MIMLEREEMLTQGGQQKALHVLQVKRIALIETKGPEV